MYSIFILGAGFSKPAGFPLGQELFLEILREAKRTDLYENILKRDIGAFIEYKRISQAIEVIEEEIDLEEFVSFLDIEHILDLEGPDTWSREGNRSQIVIRNLIGLILFRCSQNIRPERVKLYKQFVSHLEPKDYVLTFNYDTLLERALDEVGVPYRLYPLRFESVSRNGGTVADEPAEVVVLKLHGSIDWFDLTNYELSERSFRSGEYFQNPKHIIFDDHHRFNPTKIIDQPYWDDSPLQKVYMIKNLGDYYGRANYVTEVPLIISPSMSKLAYLNPVREFWSGLNKAGGANLKVAIIGFSLPEYDEYVRQPLYTIVRNFQEVEIGGGIKKSNLKLIDYRPDDTSKSAYLNNFRFVNLEKADCYFEGFDENAINVIFDL